MHTHSPLGLGTRTPRRRAAQPDAPGGVCLAPHRRQRTRPSHFLAPASKLADVLPHPRHALPSHSVEVFTALATDHAPTPCPVRHGPWPRPARVRAKDYGVRYLKWNHRPRQPVTAHTCTHLPCAAQIHAPALGLDSPQKFSDRVVPGRRRVHLNVSISLACITAASARDAHETRLDIGLCAAALRLLQRRACACCLSYSSTTQQPRGRGRPSLSHACKFAHHRHAKPERRAPPAPSQGILILIHGPCAYAASSISYVRAPRCRCVDEDTPALIMRHAHTLASGVGDSDPP
ncbi:hypothetical protein JB92DRAFT_386257 [Gautieria morchelliformis]|nr:hypothetical protein JB92DRAFT_386257 [Gautieria morchelliformis]